MPGLKISDRRVPVGKSRFQETGRQEAALALRAEPLHSAHMSRHLHYAYDPGQGRQHWRTRAVAWSVALLLVIVLYFLSWGAVIYFNEKQPLPPNIRAVLDVVYHPIGWLHDHTPLRAPLESYVGFCVWLARDPLPANASTLLLP